MKIYFSASIHGIPQVGTNYERIAELVRKAGHTFVDDDVVGVTHEEMEKFTEEDSLKFYHKVHNSMKKADAFFAELSYTSTSVGYMIAQAVNFSKPVVIFFSGKQEPHMFTTLERVNERVMIVRYNDLKDLDKEVQHALDFVSESQDVRFNFFVSPKHSNYLNWISKTKRIPRSVYLRKLIDDQIINSSNQ